MLKWLILAGPVTSSMSPLPLRICVSNPNVYWRITTAQVVQRTHVNTQRAIRTRNVLAMHAARVRA